MKLAQDHKLSLLVFKKILEESLFYGLREFIGSKGCQQKFSTNLWVLGSYSKRSDEN